MYENVLSFLQGLKCQLISKISCKRFMKENEVDCQNNNDMHK
jgi:hypothetical protein